MFWKHALRVCLIGALIAVSGVAVTLGAMDHEPHVFPDGVRGKSYPIILVIETHEAIQKEAIRRGMLKEDAETSALGFASYNEALTICTIWVPTLRMNTMWIWVHEILHCNIGAFHGD